MSDDEKLSLLAALSIAAAAQQAQIARFEGTETPLDEHQQVSLDRARQKLRALLELKNLYEADGR
jgi:hypothetical protein